MSQDLQGLTANQVVSAMGLPSAAVVNQRVPKKRPSWRCPVPVARNTGMPTLKWPDCGRQLFGGFRPRQKTWPLGNLRTQLWWRLVRPRLGN